jgi:AcrR family transcriptional regulator
MVRDEQERRALQAAGEVFRERGIQGASVDSVRDATGLSLKRIYARYGTKEALVVATLAEHAERDIAELHARTSGTTHPRAAILAVFDLAAEWVSGTEFRGCPFLNAYAEMGSTSPPIATVVHDQREAIRLRLAELTSAAGGPPALADQLLLLVNGAMVSAALAGSTDPVRGARDAAATLMDAAGISA